MSENIHSGCHQCQFRSPVFISLSESELAKVDHCRVSMHYKPGEIIFKQGAPCYDYVCVTSGLVKLSIESEQDKNLIFGFAKPVDYIFSPGAYFDKRHHFTATACTDTYACLVGIETIQELVRTNPEFANNFISKISQQVIYLFRHLTSLTQKQMPGRVAEVLLYLSEEVYEANPFNTNISRQDIAEMAGMTKESAIRALKVFKDEGIIAIEGNSITLLNVEKLKNISRNG